LSGQLTKTFCKNINLAGISQNNLFIARKYSLMATQKKFQESLASPKEFTITYELVPGRGSSGQKIDGLLAFAGQAHEDGRIKALSITDNAGGHPALAPIAIGSEVRAIGIEPLLHFSLKDKNRNQIESHIFLYHRQQFKTLLIMGGDYPRPAYYGQAKPVFDLDSVQTLQLLSDLKDGSYKKHLKVIPDSFPPFSLFCGCVVSPFKYKESEQVWQYAKLLRKIRAGASFIVTQLGYDVCKFEELIHFLQDFDINLPILANVFIPSLTVARIMAKGGIPGILFPENLLKLMEKENKISYQNFAKKRLERAAKMISVLKGLGYSGVHIGGNNLSFEDVRYVLDTSEEITTKWENFKEEINFSVPDSWYFYGPPENKECGRSRNRLSPGQKPGGVHIQNMAHTLFFSKSSITGRLFGRFCRLCASTDRTTGLLKLVERLIKVVLFRCQMCGDCTLSESTYLCPQSGCPKKLLNGPCGGSRKTACEVFPDKRCFWVRVYDRLPADTTIESLGSETILPPKNWALDRSSSWINYFLKKDAG